MGDLLKRSFDIFVKMQWHKEIDKAVDQYNKATVKARQKRYVLNELLNAYKEKYGEDLRGAKDGK